MKESPLIDRLLKIPEEVGKPWWKISDDTGIGWLVIRKFKNLELDTLTYNSVERLGRELGYIPLVFINKSDNQYEDLENTKFLEGEEIENYFGKVLKKHINISKNAFAKSVGLNHMTINSYVKGSLKPHINTLEKISNLLNLNPNYLLIPNNSKNDYRAPYVFDERTIKRCNQMSVSIGAEI
jgi:transcriptional regulator with XRE-family HTH domain